MTGMRWILSCGILLLALGGSAQPATPEQRAGVTPNELYGTLHFTTELGSFRVIDGEGRLDTTFTGTFLVNNVDGKVTVSGALRKEYDAMKRQVYTGTGRITIVGKWRAAHWFGRSMKSVWYGKGIVQLVGDFDKNMNTGFYWFDNPLKKNYWFSAGITTVYLPPMTLGKANAKPVRRNRPVKM